MMTRTNNVQRGFTPYCFQNSEGTKRMNRYGESNKGFTLLIAIILASVALLVGLALADVAYKQVVLSTTAKQSSLAFYAADSALECTLYYDQRRIAFDHTTPLIQSELQCDGAGITNYATNVSGSVRTTTFSTPCTGGVTANVTVYKVDTMSGASCGANGAKTCIYADGYNSCNASDRNRLERGLKVLY
jgi:Tfp pilus assembly protein PilX